jgi:hypothetical protein
MILDALLHEMSPAKKIALLLHNRGVNVDVVEHGSMTHSYVNTGNNAAPVEAFSRYDSETGEYVIGIAIPKNIADTQTDEILQKIQASGIAEKLSLENRTTTSDLKYRASASTTFMLTNEDRKKGFFSPDFQKKIYTHTSAPLDELIKSSIKQELAETREAGFVATMKKKRTGGADTGTPGS